MTRQLAGWVFVAFVIDAYARRILGWRTATAMTAELVLRQGSCRISGFESDHTVGVWLTRE